MAMERVSSNKERGVSTMTTQAATAKHRKALAKECTEVTFREGIMKAIVRDGTLRLDFQANKSTQGFWFSTTHLSSGSGSVAIFFESQLELERAVLEINRAVKAHERAVA